MGNLAAERRPGVLRGSGLNVLIPGVGARFEPTWIWSVLMFSPEFPRETLLTSDILFAVW